MNRIRCELEINDLNKLLYIYDENLANVIYGCLGYVTRCNQLWEWEK